MGGAMVKICDSCGFGGKADECIKCGTPIYSGGAMVKMCDSCGFGGTADECIKCGTPTY